MRSWLWELGFEKGVALGRSKAEAWARAQGEALARTEGEVRALRRVCAEMVKQVHPRVAQRLLPAIDACDHPDTLHAWVVECPTLSGAEFAALVTGQPRGTPGRSRANRPSAPSESPRTLAAGRSLAQDVREDLPRPALVRASPRSPGKAGSFVDADRPIKVLFERQGQSLLPFVGEAAPGVHVAAVESVELPVATRRIDSVLRLEREGLVWYRHLEFQSGPDPDMPRRCFEYNSRLILHYDAPVFTTVLYLVPGSDSGAQDAFRLFLGDRVAYEWCFDVVRLWEIDVRVALESGQAGPLGLVPLLRGGDEPDRLLAAVRMLDGLPPPDSADAMATLLDLASRRYDRAKFSNVLGKDRVMQSWLWQLGWDEGEVQGEARGEARGRAEGEVLGRAEGEVGALRRVCVELTKELHPRMAGRLVPLIESCDRPDMLQTWILQCPTLKSPRFAALVTGQPSGRVVRSRTSRPSRRSRRGATSRRRH